ncbi:MAG TPA: RICIN domain-containing protein [Terracidiphilus sp.]|nr:RICIN domain-containing protein [Terracidiphilus sp.]
MRGDFRVGERLVRPRLNSIEYNDSILRLEPKVMHVLLVLAEHAGDVVTREKLRETVWPDIFVGDDVLVRAISELRRAFQDDPHTHHTIETIPKVGYRLIAPVVEATEEPLPVVASYEPDFGSAVLPEDEAVQPSAVAQLQPLPYRRSRRMLLLTAVLVLISFGVVVLGVHTYVQRSGGRVVAASPPKATVVPSGPLSPGSCTPISGAIYEIENQQTGAVLEVPYASATNGTLLDQWKSNGGDNQRWILTAKGPYWTFTNVSSGKLLDDPGANRTSGVQVDQWQTNDGENQNWIVLPVGDKSCKIISQASGLLLDVMRGENANGTAIIQYTDNDGSNQHWIFHLIRKAG